MKKFLQNSLVSIKNQMSNLCEMFRVEFGDKLNSGKIVIRLMKCNHKKCSYCPHGPYWYRAFFDTSKRRFLFKYIGASLRKSMLRKDELKNWERYKFYDNEIKRLKKEKRAIIKQIKELEK